MLIDPAAFALAVAAVRAADDKKGEEIVVLEVGQVTILADYFVIVTGNSRAQVRAIGGAIEEKIALSASANRCASKGWARAAGCWSITAM